jgi:hypothetical protein
MLLAEMDVWCFSELEYVSCTTITGITGENYSFLTSSATQSFDRPSVAIKLKTEADLFAGCNHPRHVMITALYYRLAIKLFH